MSLRERVQKDLREAVKARDTERVSTLRLLEAQLMNEQLALRKELEDEDVQRVVQREVKRRREAAEGFLGGGRPDAAAREDAERAILEQYLPAQLSDTELEKIIRETVGTSAAGAGNRGKLIGAVMAKVRGRADGTHVRALVEKIVAP